MFFIKAFKEFPLAQTIRIIEISKRKNSKKHLEKTLTKKIISYPKIIVSAKIVLMIILLLKFQKAQSQ